ncbi:hypothetical protein CAOG_03522 [Capsaspora owczarzaki ATCC 30864]|uniref:TNFR-Cys domain-containing protein n=1 Tax=Capsaspora owczarzaki (strain ATCC 30864) TaxID=595528 RepID=A0A0D2WPJ8_CAPO3|nr:hypothetical protein CAOG_03522 [Capsaspora owczarzaki ATCC 30864]KJE92587.1 hypothetical protein CAOG_003522 [Capsaspora owczarzaki ATCC 30864]KJE92588.1 hypothetical protein, variant 1 [Capsaspora owczarzaki ATCC 30864]KJE92589.1 hypothetical protein, variant 2 [Capsaspora owczarzaki ATCC 30864]|eukprot:XP_004348427.1 hypothetical protein CAOG_03522 [Capsaspora owczarzaki ATCC 30864]
MTLRLAILLVVLMGVVRFAQAQTASCSNAPAFTGSSAARAYTGSIGQYNAPWDRPQSAGTGGAKCLTWQYTPLTVGTIYMTTCGLASDDTIMMISSGGCVNNFGTNLNQMADDSCSLQSTLSFPATAGTLYYLHLCRYTSSRTDTGSAGLANGNVVFNFQCPAGMTDHDSLLETACVACGAGTDTSTGAKAGPCTNFNVPAGSFDHDSNSATAAITCPPGNYAPAAGTTCTTCGTETWDHDSSSATACTSCTSACSAGTFQSQACTPTSNRACTSCTAVTSCAASSTTCTSSTDSRCSTCAANFYKVAGASSDTCQGCTAACTTGTFETTPCTTASNRVCTACPAIANCGGTLSCSSSSTSRCTACASNFYLIAGTGSTPDRCAPCSGSCAVGQFQSAACGAAADRVCTTCTSVANCVGQVTCTTSGNSQCSACASGYYRTTVGGADVCSPCASTCALGQFESVACTTSTNRVCTSCTSVSNCASQQTCYGAGNTRCYTCATDFYLTLRSGVSDVCTACASCGVGNFSLSPCSPSVDRVCGVCTAIGNCNVPVSCTSPINGRCSACASEHYLVPGSSDVALPSQDACAACDTCEVGTFESQACTHATNRNCTQCTPIENCAQVSCTDTTDSVCVQCPVGTFYNTTSATCHSCLECASNEFEVVACTYLTDRTCSACTNVTNCASVTCTSLDDSICETCKSTTYISPNATAGDAEQCLACAAVADCAYANVVCTNATNARCSVAAASSIDKAVIIPVVAVAGVLLLVLILVLVLVARRRRRNARKPEAAVSARRTTSDRVDLPMSTIAMLANPLSDHGSESGMYMEETYSPMHVNDAGPSGNPVASAKMAEFLAQGDNNLYDSLGGGKFGFAPHGASGEELYDDIRPPPPADPLYTNSNHNLVEEERSPDYEAPSSSSPAGRLSTAASSSAYEDPHVKQSAEAGEASAEGVVYSHVVHEA